MVNLRSKIGVALLLLLAMLIIGVVGFKFTMDLSWLDALYMTVITITTVGYREISDPTDGAKLFTVCLILFSVVIVGYAVSVISEFLLARSSVAELRKKQRLKKINAMRDHVIICGYGRNGKQAAQKLIDYEREFVIVEMDQEVIDTSGLDKEMFLRGNAIEDDTLIKAGIKHAEVLITALPEDADNLFIVLSARQLNENLRIISRASEETSYRKLKLAGADSVILPDTIGGEHMASLVVSPDLLEFWDRLSYRGNEGVNLEQVNYDQITHDNRSCSMLDLNIRKETGCTIIGYKSPDGQYEINPSAETQIKPGSKLIVLGNNTQIKKLRELYHV